MSTTPSLPSGWVLYPSLTKAQIVEFQQAGIEFLHAQLLYNRGMRTPQAMQRFLAARLCDVWEPLALVDVGLALERIQRALATREPITVFGDFDADGVTSAALLTRALRTLQPAIPLDAYIPHRTQDARGLSREALDQIKTRGSTLIITADCGSSDVEAVEYARALGIDVIITDHHQLPAELPRPYALINPWRPDCTYPERYLCGAGVAFKLVQALFERANRGQEAQDLLDLVAVGTIADVADLLGENHAFVRLGLQRLNRTGNIGLQALMQAAGLRAGSIRERDVAYGLAPRLNAAGRMAHAQIAYRLLVTDDPDEARALAWELEALNRLRQQQTAALMLLAREQAQSQVDKQVVLVCGEKDTWPEGIIGLVAGKLAEELKRPVFVLSEGADSCRGSARSYGGVNLMEALQAGAELFLRFGGHAQAAGFTLTNDNIEALRQHLLAWQKPADAAATVTSPMVMVDLVIARPELLGVGALASIDRLSPFGKGNPEPVFQMDNLRLTHYWASGAAGDDMKVRLQFGAAAFKGTYKGGGPSLATFSQGSLVTVISRLSQALRTGEEEGDRNIWLQVLHMSKTA